MIQSTGTRSPSKGSAGQRGFLLARKGHGTGSWAWIPKESLEVAEGSSQASGSGPTLQPCALLSPRGGARLCCPGVLTRSLENQNRPGSGGTENASGQRRGGPGTDGPRTAREGQGSSQHSRLQGDLQQGHARRGQPGGRVSSALRKGGVGRAARVSRRPGVGCLRDTGQRTSMSLAKRGPRARGRTRFPSEMAAVWPCGVPTLALPGKPAARPRVLP